MTAVDGDQTTGDTYDARFVVMANGPLHRPKLPGIPGIEDFAGHSFHTSRWDYDYTGGDTTGGMTKLADKRVAIIGTGATAVQCIPHLARDAPGRDGRARPAGRPAGLGDQLRHGVRRARPRLRRGWDRRRSPPLQSRFPRGGSP